MRDTRNTKDQAGMKDSRKIGKVRDTNLKESSREKNRMRRSRKIRLKDMLGIRALKSSSMKKRRKRRLKKLHLRRQPSLLCSQFRFRDCLRWLVGQLEVSR